MLAIGSAGACALLLIATIGFPTHEASAGANAAAEANPLQAAQSSIPSESYDGVITDTRCGAKHSARLAESAADCTRLCVHSGERFALVDGEKLYVLEGKPEALKRFAGERVRIVGTLNGNTISVESVGSPVS
jgi:hypothetical protein